MATKKKVICKDDSGLEKLLTKNKVYEASAHDNIHYELTGDDGKTVRVLQTRFQDVSKRVRCLNDAPNDSGKSGLVKGQIYEADPYYNDPERYKLVGVDPAIWFKTRFEDVEDEALTPLSKVASQKQDDDPEETRLRALFTAPQKGYCMCGILKSVCSFHGG
jgi:hypothetical protein